MPVGARSVLFSQVVGQRRAEPPRRHSPDVRLLRLSQVLTSHMGADGCVWLGSHSCRDYCMEGSRCRASRAVKGARQRLRFDQRTRASALQRRRPLPLQRAALRQQRRKSSRRRFVIVSEKPEHWPMPLLLWNMTATSLQCQLRCLPCQASVVSVLPACVLFCADGRTSEAYVCAYICIRIICYEKGAEREREREREGDLIHAHISASAVQAAELEQRAIQQRWCAEVLRAWRACVPSHMDASR